MFGKDVKRASRQKVITLKLTTNSYCSSVFSLYLLIFKDSFGWSLRIKIILWILFELFWFRLVHLRTIIVYTPLSLLKYQGSFNCVPYLLVCASISVSVHLAPTFVCHKKHYGHRRYLCRQCYRACFYQALFLGRKAAKYHDSVNHWFTFFEKVICFLVTKLACMANLTF